MSFLLHPTEFPWLRAVATRSPLSAIWATAAEVHNLETTAVVLGSALRRPVVVRLCLLCGAFEFSLLTDTTVIHFDILG